MATKKQTPEPQTKAKVKVAAAPVVEKRSPIKVSAKQSSSTIGENTSKRPSSVSKAALSAPAKATMEKTAPKTSQAKSEPKAPKAQPTSPVKAKLAKAAPAEQPAVTKALAAPKPSKTAKVVKPVADLAAPATPAKTKNAEKVEKVEKVEKTEKTEKAVKPAKTVKSETVPAADAVVAAPTPVKGPKESKKAVKPPTAKSIAADAISALAVATPSAAALAENAVKAAKPTPAPTPRVVATPAKGSLVPITPRLVKLLKAPALNQDDPFDGIEELSEGQFLSQQQEVLTNERRQYESSATMLQAEADQLAADMEPGDVQFDDESGEGTGVSVERERDIAMAQKASETVDEIDRALSRIGIGTYGYCIECHEMINRDRLRAMPFAVLCMKCKTGGLSRR